jgi:hypothetical protein
VLQRIAYLLRSALFVRAEVATVPDRQPPQQPPSQRPPAPENRNGNADRRAAISGADVANITGAENAGAWEQRRKGPRAARRLAAKLRAGRDLSPDKVLRLQHVCLLAVHLHNLSLRLFKDGETRTDGECKAALAKLLEMDKAVRDGLQALFGDEADESDPLARLLGGGR